MVVRVTVWLVVVVGPWTAFSVKHQVTFNGLHGQSLIISYKICAVTLLPRLEFHHHDVGVAGVGVALAVQVTAVGMPGNEDVARSIYLCQLGLGRRSTYLLENL